MTVTLPKWLFHPCWFVSKKKKKSHTNETKMKGAIFAHPDTDKITWATEGRDRTTETSVVLGVFPVAYKWKTVATVYQTWSSLRCMSRNCGSECSIHLIVNDFIRQLVIVLWTPSSKSKNPNVMWNYVSYLAHVTFCSWPCFFFFFFCLR